MPLSHNVGDIPISEEFAMLLRPHGETPFILSQESLALLRQSADRHATITFRPILGPAAIENTPAPGSYIEPLGHTRMSVVTRDPSRPTQWATREEAETEYQEQTAWRDPGGLSVYRVEYSGRIESVRFIEVRPEEFYAEPESFEEHVTSVLARERTLTLMPWGRIPEPMAPSPLDATALPPGARISVDDDAHWEIWTDHGWRRWEPRIYRPTPTRIARIRHRPIIHYGAIVPVTEALMRESVNIDSGVFSELTRRMNQVILDTFMISESALGNTPAANSAGAVRGMTIQDVHRARHWMQQYQEPLADMTTVSDSASALYINDVRRARRRLGHHTFAPARGPVSDQDGERFCSWENIKDGMSQETIKPIMAQKVIYDRAVLESTRWIQNPLTIGKEMQQRLTLGEENDIEKEKHEKFLNDFKSKKGDELHEALNPVMSIIHPGESVANAGYRQHNDLFRAILTDVLDETPGRIRPTKVPLCECGNEGYTEKKHIKNIGQQ